jgi:hypothetical protein
VARRRAAPMDRRRAVPKVAPRRTVAPKAAMPSGVRPVISAPR